MFTIYTSSMANDEVQTVAANTMFDAIKLAKQSVVSKPGMMAIVGNQFGKPIYRMATNSIGTLVICESCNK